MNKNANDIKKELREEGISTKGVSIRVDCRAIRVWIKNPNVSSSAVKEILSKYESISYCYASGEILSGGNTYVFVHYDIDYDKEKEFKQEAIQMVVDGTFNFGKSCFDYTLHDSCRKMIAKKFVEKYEWNEEFAFYAVGNISIHDKEIKEFYEKQS